MSLTLPQTPPFESVLVTGATGFIGSHIVECLREGGGLSIIECARSSGAPDLFNRDATRRFIHQHRPQACIHAAWDASSPGYRDSPINQRWVMASLQLAEALIANDCKWLGVCGTCIEPMPSIWEAGVAEPSCRYAAAKLTLRNRLSDLIAGLRSEMTLCWWRIFQPYGPGEPEHRFVPALIEALVRGQRFHIEKPAALRDFVHVDDLASAVTASLAHAAGGVFDVGSGKLHTLQGVATMAAELLKSRHLLHAVAVNDEDDVDEAADIAPLEAITGWRPRITLEAGLRHLIEERRREVRKSA